MLSIEFAVFDVAVERYDPKTNRWSNVPTMGTRRKHLGVAVYNGMIYAVGGRDDATELSSAERYNPKANQWQPVVAMTCRRSGVTGAQPHIAFALQTVNPVLMLLFRLVWQWSMDS